jgi:hypothetical protein
MTRLVDDLDLYSDLLASVGTHQHERPLTPIQVSNLIQKLFDEQQETTQQISKRLGFKDKTHTQTKNFLRLQKLPKQIHGALGWGNAEPDKVAFTIGVYFAELNDNNEIIKGIKACLENDISKNEARRIVDLKKKNPATPIEECIEKVKKIRPIIDVSYIISNKILKSTKEQLNNISIKQNKSMKEILLELLKNKISKGKILSVLIKEQTVFLSVDEHAFQEIENMTKKMSTSLENFLEKLLVEETHD